MTATVVTFDPKAECIVAGEACIELEHASDDGVYARLDAIGPLAGATATSFEEGIRVTVWSTDGFGTYLFHEADVFRDRGRPGAAIEFRHHHPNKYWDGRFGLATLLAAMRDQLAHHPSLTLADIDLEDDWKRLSIIIEMGDEETVEAALRRGAEELVALHREATIALGGLTWKAEYETNERLFCTEVLAPLLRRMGFQAVHYTQGPREFGKDFTFSEPTRFGHLRHYGLQAKCGDLRGNVNSEVDEIIGQLDDAFKMPYIDVSAGEERYISTFIVAISGRFTDNAKEKIVRKIPRGLVGSVVFLDRERIWELVEQHWTAV